MTRGGVVRCWKRVSACPVMALRVTARWIRCGCGSCDSAEGSS